MIRRIAVALAALSLTAALAHADSELSPFASSFQPRVPVSLLGTLGGLGSRFDPTQFHLTSTFSVGSGYGGSGTNALQVTSFSYQFRAPLAMSVSVGNAFGPGSTSGSSMFLSGVDLAYKPSANSLFRVQFQNVRSPLQYGYGYGPARGLWGY
jgi:hypothetical protein